MLLASPRGTARVGRGRSPSKRIEKVATLKTRRPWRATFVRRRVTSAWHPPLIASDAIY